MVTARRVSRALEIVALIAGATSTLSAQSSPLVPGRVTAAIGAGYGAATLSCGACSTKRESSIAGLLRVGVAVSHNFVLALEASGWTKDYGTPTSNATTRIGFADIVAQWYPAKSAGLFLKGGGGVSRIRDDITATGIPKTSIATSSSDVTAGLGWDIPLARRLAVTPYADFHRAAKKAARVNNVSSTEKLGATLLLVGLSATWR